MIVMLCGPFSTNSRCWCLRKSTLPYDNDLTPFYRLNKHVILHYGQLSCIFFLTMQITISFAKWGENIAHVFRLSPKSFYNPWNDYVFYGKENLSRIINIIRGNTRRVESLLSHSWLDVYFISIDSNLRQTRNKIRTFKMRYLPGNDRLLWTGSLARTEQYRESLEINRRHAGS